MTEKRNCEICTVIEGKGCYMKMAEEINETANTLPEPSQDLSEEEKFRKGQDTALSIHKTISNLEEEAKKNYCKNNNSIVTDNKWNKYL